nr:DUF839 domain-containing protein [Rhodobacter sp.]
MARDYEDDISFDEYDDLHSPRPETCDFDRIVEAAISRRGMLGGVLAFGSIGLLGGTALTTPAKASTDRFAFTGIAANTADDITVPDGFSAKVLVRWGDPLTSDGPDFDHATRGTGDSQAVTFGDNTDGMEVFAHGDKLLLAV